MLYILKKTGVLIVTLLVISLFVFAAFQIIPGDPTAKMLGTDSTPEQAAALRAELGLDKPLLIRYIGWLTGFLTGDLGRSYSYNMPVRELIAGKLPLTLTLSAIAFLLIVLVAIPLGLLLARYEGGITDRVFTVINQIVMSVPPFFTGVIVTFVFGLTFKLFTPGGFVPFAENPRDFFVYLFFPAAAIALPRCAMTVKLLRSSILSEMKRDYVRTAYSRGNSRASALKNHVLRNAVIPVVTFLALTLADVVAGSIIIEQVFAIPGIGRLLLASVSNRDYAVVSALVVIIAVIVVTVNFIADIAYQYIDPRIRLS